MSEIVNRIGDISLTRAQFFADLRAEVVAQYQKCAAYGALCQRQSFDPEKDLEQPGDETKIPWVTSNSFKKSHGMFMKLLRRRPHEIEVWTASSGTSGDPSLVGRSQKEVEAYVGAYVAGQRDHMQDRPRWDVSHLYWIDPDPIVARSEQLMSGKVHPYGLLTAYDPGLTHDPQARQFVAQFNPQTGGFSIDSEATIAAMHRADEAGQTLFIGGAVILVYGALYQYAKYNGHSFNFGDRCHVQFGAGGWSGQKGRMKSDGPIPKEEFVLGLRDLLGLDSTRYITDFWGATETSFGMPGHYSDSLGDFVFHELPWARIIVRDPETLAPLNKVGDRGLLEVLSPYGAHSYAGVAILIDDIIEIVEVDDLPCEHDGPLFRIIGRAKGAEAKGCGMIVGDMMEG